jgi:phosphoribosylformylglycinamidine cyclo-ligase
MTQSDGSGRQPEPETPAGGAKPSISYRDAGVDREAAAAAKQRIAALVESTRTADVLSEIGSFGGGFRVPVGDSEAILVSSADGVGTKLKVAVMTGVHDTVGYDIVAHCADDILTQGALPLFFLDYLALGSMDEDVVEAVLRGVASGCRDVGAALIGGETAEMPDLYAAGEYDLAGFIVGRTVRDSFLDGSAIRPGDVLLGLASNGLHTNGYSLARKILFEVHGLEVSEPMSEWGLTVGEELLRPHRAYVASLRAPLERGDIHGLAHITGGGIPENVPRMMPDGCGAAIDPQVWDVPPVFRTLQDLGGVPDDEMWKTFNMGVGMVVAVPLERAAALTQEIEAAGEVVYTIGVVAEGNGVTFEPGLQPAP